LHRFNEALHAEKSVLIAGAEITGAQLPDDVGSLQVIGRNTALACPLQTAGELTAAVQRLHGNPSERAETHRRYADSTRPKFFRTVTPPTDHLRTGDRKIRRSSDMPFLNFRQGKA